MKYDTLLIQTMESGYITSSTALIGLIDETISIDQLPALQTKVRRLINKAVEMGHLKSYNKDGTTKIYGLSKEGERYLASQGYKNIESTAKNASSATNYSHRLVADAITRAMHLFSRKTTEKLNIRHGIFTEKKLLNSNTFFQSEFGKVPDGIVWCDLDYRRLTWIEIDRSRRSKNDTQRLLDFIWKELGKFSRKTEKNSFGNPDILLIVCTPEAHNALKNNIKNSFKGEKNYFDYNENNLFWCDFENDFSHKTIFIVKLDFSKITAIPEKILFEINEHLEDAYPIELLR